jgi:hypothetical protein
MSQNYFNQAKASLKIKCLELVISQDKEVTEIVKDAKVLYDFVMEGTDFKTIPSQQE